MGYLGGVVFLCVVGWFGWLSVVVGFCGVGCFYFVVHFCYLLGCWHLVIMLRAGRGGKRYFMRDLNKEQEMLAILQSKEVGSLDDIDDQFNDPIAEVYRYARDVIEGRWPEAEPYIMRDRKWAYYYAEDVIEGRWPEAEPFIMEDAEIAYFYAYYNA